LEGCDQQDCRQETFTNVLLAELYRCPVPSIVVGHADLSDNPAIESRNEWTA
jgi:hypothetical protein